MRGLISFHPIAPGFFEELVEPLFRGEKVNPQAYLDAATRTRRAAWQTHRYKLAIEALLDDLEPPPIPAEGSFWMKTRAWLDRFDHRPPPLAPLAATKVVADLHLHGRPFLITEGSARKSAEIAREYGEAADENAVTNLVLDQLIHLDPRLARELEPEQGQDLTHDMNYTSELLRDLRSAIDVVHAARSRDESLAANVSEQAIRDLPRRLVELHSRAVPFWVARDVDGLVTICTNTGIDPPGWLRTSAHLFSSACAAIPGFSSRLRLETRSPGDLGAYVEPGDVPRLLEFLDNHGSTIIRAATNCGEGPACRTLLRKIRECARFAELRGGGYLEASGITPPFETEDETPDTPTPFA